MSARRGQTSLEMSLAMAGALLLLLGCIKVFFWMNERLIMRQRSYEATRVQAAGTTPDAQWLEPSQRLNIFK